MLERGGEVGTLSVHDAEIGALPSELVCCADVDVPIDLTAVRDGYIVVEGLQWKVQNCSWIIDSSAYLESAGWESHDMASDECRSQESETRVEVHAVNNFE